MTYRYDQQNGAEGILFMLAAAASKANLLAGIGSTHNAIGMSAEMMLIHTAWLEAAGGGSLIPGWVSNDRRN